MAATALQAAATLQAATDEAVDGADAPRQIESPDRSALPWPCRRYGLTG